MTGYAVPENQFNITYQNYPREMFINQDIVITPVTNYDVNSFKFDTINISYIIEPTLTNISDINLIENDSYFDSGVPNEPKLRIGSINNSYPSNSISGLYVASSGSGGKQTPHSRDVINNLEIFNSYNFGNATTPTDEAMGFKLNIRIGPYNYLVDDFDLMVHLNKQDIKQLNNLMN